MKKNINIIGGIFNGFLLILTGVGSSSFGLVFNAPNYDTMLETAGGAGDAANNDYNVTKNITGGPITNETSLYFSFDFQVAAKTAGTDHAMDVFFGGLNQFAVSYRTHVSSTNYVITGPGPSFIDTGIVIDTNTPVKFVVKLNQISGALTVWAGADLSLKEADQAGYSRNFNVAANSSINDYSVIEGNWNNEGTAYTGRTLISNAAFYTGGDTPFAVPEPATYALIIGGLTLGFVMLRRRIKC